MKALFLSEAVSCARDASNWSELYTAVMTVAAAEMIVAVTIAASKIAL